MKINYYQNVTAPTVMENIDHTEWVAMNKGSVYTKQILEAREGKQDYNYVKKSVPCVTYQFFYEKYKKDNNIIASTGLLYFDIDSPEFNPDIMDKTKVYQINKSFGGFGYSIVVKVDGLTIENYRHNFAYFADLLGLGEFIDKNAAKASQFTCLSYDPDLYVNEAQIPFEAITLEEKQKHPPAERTLMLPKKKASTIGWGVKYIRYDNLDEIEVNGPYAVNWDGWEYVKCWIPIHKKNAGRNNMLFSYCGNLVWLNPYITRDKVLTIMSAVNQIAFHNPVDNSQLLRVVDSIMKYRQQGTLKPVYFKQKRKILFNNKSGYTGKEKSEIALQLCNEKRSSDSQQKIYEIIEAWDFEKHGKISQAKIHNNYSVGKNTVEKHWHLYKDYVHELNEEYKKITVSQ